MSRRKMLVLAAAVSLAATTMQATSGAAEETGPQLADPNLEVLKVIDGLSQPTSMAFVGDDEMFVLEKNTGKVQIVRGRQVVGTALDLPVNSASERGLLGIALHPDFAHDHGVYLYWTESASGADSTSTSDVPLLGNRVDRFVWNGSSLTFDRTLIRLRSRQNDATNGTERANHNGGVIRFGPDGKLYVMMGDQGRRGQLQNLPDGPGCVMLPCPDFVTTFPAGGMSDDQYGGPEPDDAHLTGMVLRLNDDGSTPHDNPFYKAGQELGGQAGANIAKLFAYGVRNGFGLAFDPHTGDLWDAENGDDSFSEVNLIQRGENLGWIQTMGPIARNAQFREIENTPPFVGLQQVRYSPQNIAGDPNEALARMFMITEGGSRFTAKLDGAHQVPALNTGATGEATIVKKGDELRFSLRVANIQDATMAHIHLGAPGQNGPIVAFLLHPVTGGLDVGAEREIASGTIRESDIIARPGFDGSMTELLKRLRQGRAYVNVHTVAHPGGEIRGKVQVTNAKVVSKYSDPEFSWKYEVAPGGIGFMSAMGMGVEYHKDMFVGAARPNLMGGPIFRFEMRGSRNSFDFRDQPQLQDEVADNTAKYDPTESAPLLFGWNFGVTTDFHTGPNGHLYVVSNSLGAVYEIHKKPRVDD